MLLLGWLMLLSEAKMLFNCVCRPLHRTSWDFPYGDGGVDGVYNARDEGGGGRTESTRFEMYNACVGRRCDGVGALDTCGVGALSTLGGGACSCKK